VLLFYQLPQWSERQAQRIEALTRSTRSLSWVVVLATIVEVGMTVWVLLSGGGVRFWTPLGLKKHQLPRTP
jgi:hypothetical protein